MQRPVERAPVPEKAVKAVKTTRAPVERAGNSKSMKAASRRKKSDPPAA